MNIFVITGRLIKDPEVKFTSTGKAVSNISIAVDRYIKGEKTTDFPRITVYGIEAENLALYTGKGCKVAINGRIQTGQYQKDDKIIYTTDLIADHIEYLEYKEKDPVPEGFGAFPF